MNKEMINFGKGILSDRAEFIYDPKGMETSGSIFIDHVVDGGELVVRFDDNLLNIENERVQKFLFLHERIRLDSDSVVEKKYSDKADKE